MFTVVAHKNLAGAAGYFSEHLAQNDYYAADESRPGEWIGVGSARLGLPKTVSREAFVALCENRDPNTGTRLSQRQLAEGQRRVFYDFTCSAPKSVSIVAVTLDDPRLVSAHQEAARIAFGELEGFASTRVRNQGPSSDRSTGNLVAAQFLHTSSRALDPQLHSHFTVFNATWDAQETRWKALQAGPMYLAIRYATQVYRNELARRVQSAGYIIQRRGPSFEILGVPEAVLQRFSKRSAQRDVIVREMEARLGRRLSNDEISHAVHQSRPRKLSGITTAEVRARQVAQLTPEESLALGSLRQPGPSIEPAESTAAALDHAVAHVFERRSVVPEHEILETALAHRPGAVDLGRLKERLRSSPAVIATERGCTTHHILQQELGLIRAVKDGKSAQAPLHPLFQPQSWFGKDQRTALLHVLQSGDRITGLRGLAGSGKTTVLRELARACEEGGHQLRFCAPTAAATEVLRREGFEAVTLARLLGERNRTSGSVITVLDEAGAVGLADMNRLLGQSDRLILCGDSGQHGSVAQGDALRIIEEHSPFAFGTLTEIRRQRSREYRRAVERAAGKDTTGAFDMLERIGAVTELPEGKVQAAAAAAYVEATAASKVALLVAPTWNEIEVVTGKVREALKASGRLRGPDHELKTFDSLSWTVAEKRDPARYRAGQWVRFHLPRGPFRRHETVEVVGEAGGITVRREDGTVASLDVACSGHCFDVGERRSLEVAAGDRLLLQANSTGLTNGELVEVAGVEGDSVRLQDGRVLPPAYRTFTHGYAVTSHAAQGKTVDEVLVLATSRSLPAVHREQFYVSISRGRNRCRIFTDDREQLRARVTESSSRVAAVEVVNGQALRRALVRRAIRWVGQLPEQLRRWAQARHPARTHLGSEDRFSQPTQPKPSLHV